MFGSNVLDVAIGLVFIYLLISLICSAINEAISSLLNKRGKNLFLGIKTLLNDPDFTGLAQQIYNHGMIDGISKDGANNKKLNRPPSYLPPLNFSLALVDILGARGVLDAAHGPLLKAAEEADATAAKDPTPQNIQAAKSAHQALQDAFDQAKAANDVAQTAATANAALKPAADDAKKRMDIAEAALALHNARIAAIKLANQPKDVKLANEASDGLETALTLARTLQVNVPASLDQIQQAVNHLPQGHTREALAVLIDKTRRELKAGENAIEKYQKNVETWFNDAMGRVSGWYKRWTQWVLMAIAFVMVCAANVDTIYIVQRLNSDPALRGSLVAAAENASKNPPALAQTGSTPLTEADKTKIAAAEKAQLDNMLAKAKDLQLPLGWSGDQKFFTVQKFLGLLLSVLAISLGAPFWFDTLSKFVNLRGAGTPPGEKSKSAPKTTT